MIPVTLTGGFAAYLCTVQPNWKRRVSFKADVIADIVGSLVGREIRVPHGETLRCSMKWGATIDHRAFAALRDGLRDAGGAKVIVPVWPLLGSGTPEVPGGIEVGILADGTMEVDVAGVLNPADYELFGPGIVGVLKVEESRALTAALTEIELTITEDGPAEFALQPASVAWNTGPELVDGFEPTVFPWTLDPTSSTAGLPSITIDRQGIGTSRESVQVLYPNDAARSFAGSVSSLYGRTMIAQVLRWFADHGYSQSHYVASSMRSARLAADGLVGTNTITLDDASELGDYRYLELVDGSGREVVRIVGLSGNVATLAVNLSRTWNRTGTFVSLATLARHVGDGLQIEFATPTVASASLAWQELPEEYIPGAGEVRGETIGAAPTLGWLYRFTTEEFGTQTGEFLFTGYERTLAVDGDEWVSRPIEHSDLRASIDLASDDVTVKMEWHSMFATFLPGLLSGRLLLSIYTCEVSGASGSNKQLVWTGEVSRIRLDGPIVSATARDANSMFDQPMPRRLCQRQCAHYVFDPGCGLSEAGWTITAEVVSSSGHSVTLGTFARSGGLPSGFGFANWMAIGSLVRASGERISILQSTALSAGHSTLTLARAPRTAFAAAEAVSIIPECDGTPESCKPYHAANNPLGKFANWANFAGCPFVPDKNPAFKPPKTTDSPSGKK